MEPHEIEPALSELELRLERLRVLYEQYFMGLEKREPAIPRKDVDRRIYQLRRVRFNSTAMRFRFQNSVQRYNTLQQYWARTCRAIENGTYQRHVMRAARQQALAEAGQQTPENESPAATTTDARAEAARELAALMDGDLDLDAEMNSALAALEKGPPEAPTKTVGLGALGPRQGGLIRPTTTPGLTLGKLPEIRVRKSDTEGVSPRPSVDPKLAPLATPPRATPGNPLTPPGDAKKPAPPRPAPPPTPSLRPQPAAKAPPAPSLRPQAPKPTAAVGLSDERIRNLHASYLDARKQTNASAVSFEKLEKNLRDTERKLREQHKGRDIDFDVTIKGGKAILKPRLK